MEIRRDSCVSHLPRRQCIDNPVLAKVIVAQRAPSTLGLAPPYTPEIYLYYIISAIDPRRARAAAPGANCDTTDRQGNGGL